VCESTAFLSFSSCVTDASLRGFGVSDAFDVIRDRRKARRELAAQAGMQAGSCGQQRY
jgi:hypothetical protein